MTSDPSKSCYVYLTLPGQTEQVTAGRYTLTVNRRGDAQGHFVYGRSYLARPDAVAIDPLELKLSTASYSTAHMGGVFGALRDASPDYWGRRVIQRHLVQINLSELDYLLQSPDDRAGALGFGLNQAPPAPRRVFNQTLALAQVQAIADAIVADEARSPDAASHQIENLLLLGTSMGGARPKAVVEDESGLWLAKFNRFDDAWNNARVEHAMLLLARNCGINTASSRVVDMGGRDVLLVKRFDREKTASGYLRARMISALTLLRTQDTTQGRDRWSYVELAEELRRVCAQPADNAAELFRRMAFNALISNTDDHPRNHALIAKNLDWQLSPAYDLTPAMALSQDRRDLAMTCGDAGRFANASNLLSQSARFLLPHDVAVTMIDTLEQQVRGLWWSTARGAGVSEQDCEKIAPAFAYPGFRY